MLGSSVHKALTFGMSHPLRASTKRCRVIFIVTGRETLNPMLIILDGDRLVGLSVCVCACACLCVDVMMTHLVLC